MACAKLGLGALLALGLAASADAQTMWACGDASSSTVTFAQINDGESNCPGGADEQVETIGFCPRSGLSSGASSYLTFRTDPGKDYATAGLQKSIDNRDCVFPFTIGTTVYNECTRACTDDPDVTDPVISSLNPDNEYSADSKHGCKEHESTSGTGRQTSRLWCATSTDANDKPTSASFCTESCSRDGTQQQDFATVDEWGETCNPYLVMPFLSQKAGITGGTADPAGNLLQWRFDTTTCNVPGMPRRVGSENMDCADANKIAGPKSDPDLMKYYLRRAITSDSTSDSTVAITVYTSTAPPPRVCYTGDPTCCKFTVRIMDAEDPALLYPPYGPPQTLTRCEKVRQCDTNCEWEEQGPSASSDRVCSAFSSCDSCSYVKTGEAGSAYSDRVCTPLATCRASAGKYQLSTPTMATDLCGNSYYDTNTVCGTLTTCTTNEYETDHSGITALPALSLPSPSSPNTDPNGDRCGSSSAAIYIRNRQCQTLTKCIRPAIEVKAPKVNPLDSGSYIGDRVCQCPDHVGSSYPSWVDRDEAKYAFRNPTYYGVMAAGDYSCSACGSSCSGAQWQSRSCTHSRINKDYCHEAHPISQALATALASALEVSVSTFYPTTRAKIIANQDDDRAINQGSYGLSSEHTVYWVDQDASILAASDRPAATVAELYSMCYYQDTNTLWSAAFNDEFCEDGSTTNCFRAKSCGVDPACLAGLNGGSDDSEWLVTGDSTKQIALFSDSNIACSAFRECNAGADAGNEFEVAPPDTYSNRKCNAKRVPTDEQYVPEGEVCCTQVCGDGVDKEACTAGQNWNDDKYLNYAPQYSSSSECTSAGKIWQLGEGTTTSDRCIATRRVCQSCEYAQASGERGCDTWDGGCGSGSWWVTDRICQPLTACTTQNDMIQSVAPASNRNRECTELTTCEANQYVLTIPTQSTMDDAYDSDSSETNQCTKNVDTFTTDRECSCLRTCGANTDTTATIEPVPDSPNFLLRNRQCQCNPETFRTAVDTAGAKTCPQAFTCVQCRQCIMHSQFETLNDGQSTCTATTDRTCQAVLAACGRQELYYEPSNGAPTLTSDRVCADKAVCALTHWIDTTQSNDAEADRLCTPLRACNTNPQYKNYYEDTSSPIGTVQYAGFRARYVKISTAELRGSTAHRWRVTGIELSRNSLGQQSATDPSSWTVSTSSEDTAGLATRTLDGDAATGWTSDSTVAADELTTGNVDDKQWIVIDLQTLTTVETITIAQDTTLAVDAVRIRWAADTAAMTAGTWEGGESYDLHATDAATSIVVTGITMNTGDRSCLQLEKCLCTHYQSVAPTDTSNRECAALTECTDDEYESRYPTKSWLSELHTDFIYTTDRKCDPFKDYNGDQASTKFGEGPTGNDICRQEHGNVENQCNDGGDCGPHLTRTDSAGTTEAYDCGEATCPWGSDPGDCPPRTTLTEQRSGVWKEVNRRDDCLPFFHKKLVGEAGQQWTGQFWNHATVRARLPDAIIATDPDKSYKTIMPLGKVGGKDRTVLNWGFELDAERCAGGRCADDVDPENELAAEDNFFMSSAWFDAGGEPESNSGPAYWNTPMNRVKISVTHESGGHTEGATLIGDSVDGVAKSTYVCAEQEAAYASSQDAADKYPVFPVSAVPPYVVRDATGARQGGPRSPHSTGRVGTCVDANTRNGQKYEYVAATVDWQSGTGDDAKTCASFNEIECKLTGDNTFNTNAVSANQGCCVCNGGQRTVGVTLKVTSRDPLADGEAFALAREAYELADGASCDYAGNGNYGPCFYMKASDGQPAAEAQEHSVNVYEPPVDDWCVAQRIDTATFTVYVFDEQAPTLEAMTQLSVCNENYDDAETAKAYAVIQTTQPTGGGTGRPDLYPRRVVDNVDASMSWNENDGYAPRSPEPHVPKCETSDGWAAAAPAYQTAPTITSTRERIASTTRLEGTDAAWDEPQNFRIGAWKVTFYATDKFMNRGAVEVAVTVNDCTPPRIVCADITVTTKPGVCYCTVSTWSVTAVDNSGVQPKLVLDNSAGSSVDREYKFPIGASTYRAVATDLSGATEGNHAYHYDADTPATGALRHSERSCNVICTDEEKPQLTCPAQIDTSGGVDKLITWKPEEVFPPSGTRTLFTSEHLNARDNSGPVVSTFTMIYTGATVLTAATAGAGAWSGCLSNAETPVRIPSVGLQADGVTHGCSDWELLADDYSFPPYINKVLRFYAVDDAGNEESCQYVVLKESELGLWKRTMDFEGVPANDCYTPLGSGSDSPTMTCLLAGPTTAGGSICFGNTCMDVESASHPNSDGVGGTPIATVDTANVEAGVVDPNAWPLAYVGLAPSLNFSTVWTPAPTAAANPSDPAYDNNGEYTGDTEDFDCDDIGVVKGTSASGQARGYPFAKTGAGYVQRVADRSNMASAWAGAAYDFDDTDRDKLDSPVHYYVMTDPDGTIALDAGRIDLPLNLGDTVPLLVFKYQFHPGDALDKFVVKLRYFDRSSQRKKTLNLIDTSTGTDEEFCSTDAYNPNWATATGVADATNCWVYFKAEITNPGSANEIDAGAGIVPAGESWAWIDVSFELTSSDAASVAFVDDFAVGTSGCTLQSMGGYDRNAIIYNNCDVTPCCSKAVIEYANNALDSCSIERHDATQCEYDDQTPNFNLIKDTIDRLQATQSELDGVLTDIMGMLGVQ